MSSSHIRRRLPHDPWWHVFGLSFGLLFAGMLMVARLYPEYLDHIDHLVSKAILPYQTLFNVEWFLAVSILGSTIGIILAGIGAAFILQNSRFAVLQLFLLLLWTSVSMGIAKAFVERSRPDVLLWLDPLSSFSFPSGHASLSTALYGFLAVILFRRTRSTGLKLIYSSLCVLIIISVCFSRLVLNYHYFTDVVAGIFLGLFWLAVVFMLPKSRR